MEILDFLAELNRQGIRLWREGEQLRLSAPRGVMTTALQSSVAARKAEILAVLDRANTGALAFDAMQPADRPERIPLSLSQQEIWPIVAARPGSAAYQIVIARRMHLQLDLDLLERALQEVVRRHEILRTVFRERDGVPEQVVLSESGFRLERIDLSALPDAEHEAALRDQLQREASLPLDPLRGPLFRVVVLVLGAADFVLLQALHFLVSDCIGQALLEQETAELYRALAAGEPPRLPDPPFQYADFAIWQARQLCQGGYSAQLEYWKRTLAAPPQPLKALDGCRLDAVYSTRAQRCSAVVPAETLAALYALARRSNATLYMLLLAAFGVFLCQHSNQEEFIIGAPVSGRTLAGMERAAGRFLNALALRLDVSGAPTFRALLERSRDMALEAFANQDAPFASVAEMLPEAQVQVQLNFAPLSDQAAADGPSPFGAALDVNQADARYPLTLYAGLDGDALHLTLITQEGLFTTEQQAALLERMRGVLEAAASDPDIPIAALTSDQTPASSTPEGSSVAEAGTPEFAGSLTAVDLETPRSPEMERALVEIWKRLLKVENVGVQDNFFALGGSSLEAMRMILEAGETFGVNLPLNAVYRDARIAHIAAMLQARIGQQPWDALVEIQPGGDRPPIYCVHGIIGDTLWFEQLRRYLDLSQPIYGLQARGLDGLQPPQVSIEDMARLYLQEIRRHQPIGPYHIAGYSSGGNIAYEMACQLREAGQEVGLLLVIDQPNPKSDYYTVRFTPALAANIWRNLPYRVKDFLGLDPRRALKRLRNKLYFLLLDLNWALRHSGAGPRPLEIVELADYAPSLPAHIQKIIMLGYQAQLNYNPRPYPGRLTLVRAEGGRLLCSHDPLMGWGSLACEVDVRVIPGAHWGLFQEPHIRDLSAVIQACLDGAD